MLTEPLGQFIARHRDELLRRYRMKTLGPHQAALAEAVGIAGFLDDLIGELSGDVSKTPEMGRSATRHGSDLFSEGLTISQVVHDYGAVCQAVTDMAVELEAVIGADDFRTLNRCLDDAIASAVSEYSRRQRLTNDVQAFDQSLKRNNLLETAIHGFEALQTGKVSVGGSTGALVYRCLTAMRALNPVSE